MQRDYLLRMIEQLGQALIALRKMIVGGSATPDEIRDRFRSIAATTGLDLELLLLATSDTLELFVAPTGEVEPSRCWILAELLYLEALHAELEGRLADARAQYGRARMLFSLIEPGSTFLVGWPEAASRVEEIRRKLGALPFDSSD
jgi:hypothetical protein